MNSDLLQNVRSSTPAPTLYSKHKLIGYSWRVRIGIPLILLFAFIVISCIGYEWIEPEYDWLDGLYMTIITISTVGYEVVGGEMSRSGKLWSIFVIAGGLTLLTITGTQIAAFVVEGQLQGFIGRRQLHKKISALSEHVIICGFGRMGASVSRELRDAGREIVVIERDPDRLKVIEQSGYLFIAGDAQDENLLIQAGLHQASILVAVLSDDPDNLFVTLTARQDNPNILIISRAQEETSQSKMKRAGADRVVCPQLIGASRISDVVLRPAMVDFVEMAHSGVDLEMDKLLLDEGSPLIGKTLAELELPRRAGAHVVAVRHADGNTNYRPDHTLTLAVGDNLILVGRIGAAEALHKMQEKY